MFYEQLKIACARNNISPSALAREFGLSTANTGRWKNGGLPSVDILLKFAERLGVTTDFLLKGDMQEQSILAIPKEDTPMYDGIEENKIFLLIDAYRAADKQKRDAIIKFATGEEAVSLEQDAI